MSEMFPWMSPMEPVASPFGGGSVDQAGIQTPNLENIIPMWPWFGVPVPTGSFVQGDTSAGAVPLPRPKPEPAQVAQENSDKSSSGGNSSETFSKENEFDLLSALRGLKAPANPDVVKPTTPAVPRDTKQIQSGELLALLRLLGTAAQQFRPMPLGSVIGR